MTDTRKLALWRPVLGEAQNWRCCYCSRAMTDADDTADTRITIEHVIPRRFGGSNHWLNLAAACFACNTARSEVPMDPGITPEMFVDFLTDGRMLKPKYQAEAFKLFGVNTGNSRGAKKRRSRKRHSTAGCRIPTRPRKVVSGTFSSRHI